MTVFPDNHDVTVAGEEERAALAEVARRLECREPAALQLLSEHEPPLALPPSVVRVLRHAVAALIDGQAVHLTRLGPWLLTHQAADLLAMTEEEVEALVRAGRLAVTDGALGPEIALADLLAYRQHGRRQRRQALAELTRLSEEMGLYDHEE